jgi:hypothetical protein
MSLIEISGRSEDPTRQQRWSHLLTLILGLLAFVIGLNMRADALYAATPYTNVQAGIRVEYPRNWLIDFEGDYVLRVRDMSRVGFKTAIQISLRPVGINTDEYSVFRSLNITRPQTLVAYRPLSIEPYLLPDETEALAMRYAYAATEANPFLESRPVIVDGLDVLIIRGSQAIIITFLADAQTFDQDLAIFERTLQTVEF